MKNEYNWDNHFNLSEKMFNYLEENNPMGNSEKVEAISRSIIHLVYYSCFNITKNNNLKYNQENQKHGAGLHESIIRKIKNYDNSGVTNEELNIITADLLSLKNYRAAADYKADEKFDFYHVKEIFDLADEVYNKLNTL